MDGNHCDAAASPHDRAAREHAEQMERLDRMSDHVELTGLEERYHRNLRMWLGEWVRGAEQISIEDLPELESAAHQGMIGIEDVRAIRQLSLLVRGVDLSSADLHSTLLALEVSSSIRLETVARAELAATILRRAGYLVIAMAGGYEVSDDALASAQQKGVRVDLRDRPR